MTIWPDKQIVGEDGAAVNHSDPTPQKGWQPARISVGYGSSTLQSLHCALAGFGWGCHPFWGVGSE